MITPEAAKAALEAERDERKHACQAEIQAVLEKYRCGLDVAVLIRSGEVSTQIILIASD